MRWFLSWALAVHSIDGRDVGHPHIAIGIHQMARLDEGDLRDAAHDAFMAFCTSRQHEISLAYPWRAPRIPGWVSME